MPWGERAWASSPSLYGLSLEVGGLLGGADGAVAQFPERVLMDFLGDVDLPCALLPARGYRPDRIPSPERAMEFFSPM
jgi:hypothetical protein